ncbi:F-box/LRR-repeat protein At4g14103-like [Cornus florida]|uniref:F-box/LRR-repeat protein At4g14103-like n=1 Tax=Cornus florida TaxID=4283 RepID=UPI002898A68D|nr:F-box/LRR-repeat protein At4g14103-like [Cornus florida]
MNSSSKLQKIRCNKDRISNLPDPILCHILSFLPTKFAVATAILSTRWKFLWASVPILDFNDSISLYWPGIMFRNPRERHSFMNFVDRVLMLRDNELNLDKFNLDCCGNCDSTRVSKWVCFAARRNVGEIKLSLNLRHPFHLPPSFFMCNTVVVLQLNWKILVDVPENVSFSSLKVLQLNGVEFWRYECLEKILCGCPVLEDLVIRNCKWVRGCCLNVFGSALKNLTLHSQAYRIVVDAPVLEHLDIKDYSSESILMKNLCSLVKANVDVASITVGGNKFSDLLWGFSNVKFLSLSGATMEALNFAYDYTLPTFHNLTRLELTVDGWKGWNLLPKLLASSPILEVLVFVEGLIHLFNFQLGIFRFNWSPPEHVPNCLLLHLKAIEIKNFEGVADELNLVKYLLKNAKVLKKMSINCTFSTEDVNIQKKLLRFPRGSTSCQLDLIF